MTKVIGVNCGSSSLKLRLYEMEGSNEDNLAQEEIGYFLAERVSGVLNDEPNITFRKGGKECKLREQLTDHEAAFRIFLRLAQEHGSIKDPSDIRIAGHRVVHGGKDFTEPREVNEETLRLIEKNSRYAPLHNPPNKKGIEVVTALLPSLEYQAVFCDTAFHTTMPEKARLYFLPWKYYEDGVQVYGFHGTSHQDASRRGPRLIGREAKDLKEITFHLGNGSSLAAVLNGICQDTTMGFTPLQGIPMGTRSGDIDAAITEYIAEVEKFSSPKQVVAFLNKECGLKGVTGYSDMREIIAKAAEGDKRALLFREAYAYRIAKAAHAFLAPLQGLDLLIWTGGIGENDILTRQRVCSYFKWMGLELNHEANLLNKSVITLPTSRIQSVIVHADEERCYARGAFLYRANQR